MVQHFATVSPEILATLTECVQEMVQRNGARPSAELRLLQMVSSEDRESSASLHAAPRALDIYHTYIAHGFLDRVLWWTKVDHAAKQVANFLGKC